MQGEGKSTTAVMLARKFAQLGLRVLLVDADMRKPSLHSRMNLPTVPGLAEYLSGSAEGPALFKASGVDNVSVITAGQLPSNPAELLAAPAFRSLLATASADYDQVILDGPPLLGLADVPIIANVADGTLLVVEAGRARRGAVHGALKRLMGARAQVIGAVMQKYDPNATSYGYGYSSYYQYAEAPVGKRRKRWPFLKA
jgi:capsular exopolysaccharide synthesis family protein